MSRFSAIRTCAISLVTAACVSLSAVPLSAHEFWLDLEEYQVPIDGEISVALSNGQKFSGVSLSYFPRRVVLFDQVIEGERSEIKARAGDAPVIVPAPDEEGLLTLLYQSSNSTVQYPNWEKFQGFVEHKAFGDVRSRHVERGLPDERFREVYSRFAKSLVAIKDGAGHDLAQGMEIEIVALANPYTDALPEGLPVQVFYQGTPRAMVQVEIFEKDAEDNVQVTTVLTDASGIAQVPVKPGYEYMLDNVVLRVPSEERAAKFDAVWETLWASLTFAVPE